MIYSTPEWIGSEWQGSRQFFVVYEDKIRDEAIRERIFRGGDFPWTSVLVDVPGGHFGSQGGDLPQRARSCRLIDDQTNAFDIVEVVGETRDPQGRKAANAVTRQAPVNRGRETIILPREGHRIVRVAWSSSAELELVRTRTTPQDWETLAQLTGEPLEIFGPGMWSYVPVFKGYVRAPRYVLAFWEVPLEHVIDVGAPGGIILMGGT